MEDVLPGNSSALMIRGISNESTPDAVIELPGGAAAMRSDYRYVDKRPRDIVRHEFDDILSLAGWMNRHFEGREKGVTVLCGENKVEAFEADVAKVTATMKYSVVFRRWLNEILEKSLGYKGLLSALRQVEATIPSWDFSVILGNLMKLKLVKSSEVQIVTGPNQNTTFASKTNNASVEGALPRFIMVTCPIFTHDGADASPYEFRVDIDLDTDADVPLFTLRSPELVNVVDRARKDAIALFRTALNGDFLVGYGKIDVAQAAPVWIEGKAEFGPPSACGCGDRD